MYPHQLDTSSTYLPSHVGRVPILPTYLADIPLPLALFSVLSLLLLYSTLFGLQEACPPTRCDTPPSPPRLGTLLCMGGYRYRPWKSPSSPFRCTFSDPPAAPAPAAMSPTLECLHCPPTANCNCNCNCGTSHFCSQALIKVTHYPAA